MKRSERGAALLTVLLLVAVLAVIASDTLDRLSLTTRLTGTAVAMDQSRAFGDAAERLAALRIGQLVAADPARTTNAMGWQGVPLPLPLPIGQATLTVTDGGNCFNLNSLVTDVTAGEGATTPNLTAVDQFAALMQLLNIAPGDARRIAESAADWIDSDSVPLPAGAEDAAYRGLTPSYLPANRPMVSATELRAVAGVTPAIWSVLRPWVCALPDGGLSPINPNTLTAEQAPLLAMLAPNELGIAEARAALARRPADGFAGTPQFWQAAGIDPPAAAGSQIQMKSRWFDARVAVTLDGTERTSRALIDASAAPARVVRSWSE